MDEPKKKNQKWNVFDFELPTSQTDKKSRDKRIFEFQMCKIPTDDSSVEVESRKRACSGEKCIYSIKNSSISTDFFKLHRHLVWHISCVWKSTFPCYLQTMVLLSALNENGTALASQQSESFRGSSSQKTAVWNCNCHDGHIATMTRVDFAPFTELKDVNRLRLRRIVY